MLYWVYITIPSHTAARKNAIDVMLQDSCERDCEHDCIHNSVDISILLVALNYELRWFLVLLFPGCSISYSSISNSSISSSWMWGELGNVDYSHHSMCIKIHFLNTIDCMLQKNGEGHMHWLDKIKVGNHCSILFIRSQVLYLFYSAFNYMQIYVTFLLYVRLLRFMKFGIIKFAQIGIDLMCIGINRGDMKYMFA